MSAVAHTVVACLVLLTLLIIDLTLLPGHNVPILFAVPVVYVGLSYGPRPTVIVATVAMGLDLLSVLLDPAVTATWPLTFVALSIVAYFTTVESYRRQQREQREQRFQRAIDLAQEIRQPLTVIIGQCQLMVLRHETTEQDAEKIRVIEHAGRRIDEIVRTVILSGSMALQSPRETAVS
jgi:signal transduction histidine kinase